VTRNRLAPAVLVGEQECACGCGRALDEDSPSPWFATQGCQHRWQLNDSPLAPHRLALGEDGGELCRLGCLRTARHPGRLCPTHYVLDLGLSFATDGDELEDVRAEPMWKDATIIHPGVRLPGWDLRWRMWSCYRCRKERALVVDGHQGSFCAACGWGLAGPRFTAQYRPVGAWALLRLSANQYHVSEVVQPDSYAWRAWDVLYQDLLARLVWQYEEIQAARSRPVVSPAGVWSWLYSGPR
jgi:hypothetical protein